MRFVKKSEIEDLQFASPKSEHHKIWVGCGQLEIGESLIVEKSEYKNGIPNPNHKVANKRSGKKFQTKTLSTRGFLITRVQ